MAQYSKRYYHMWIATAALSASPVLAQQSAVPAGGQDGRFIYDPVSAAGQTLPPTADGLLRLRLSVALGDWPAVASILRAMPAADAAKIHLKVLESLEQSRANNLSVSVGNTPQRRPMSSQEQPGGSGTVQLPTGTLLTPLDALNMIDTLPPQAVMDNAHAAAAGRLLKKSLMNFSMPAGMEERILNHRDHWNNADESGRMNAAILLLAANCPDLAARFLPSPEQALSENSPRIQRLYLDYALAQADRNDNDKKGAVSPYLDLAFKLIQKNMLSDPRMADVAGHYLQQLFALWARTGDVNLLESWCDQLASAHTAALVKILQICASAPAPGSQGGYQARALSLQVQRRLTDMLIRKFPDLLAEPQVIASLNHMAAHWLLETEFTRMRLLAQLNVQSPTTATGPQSAPGEPQEISSEYLLMMAPQNQWIQKLYPSNSARLHRANVTLLMASDRPDEALKELAFVAREYPDSQDELLGDALSLWTKLHEGLRITQPKFTNQPIASGIPTGRATQERSIAKLLEILARGQELYGAPLSAALRPPYLDRLYSQTEVFSRKDIQALMGPAEQLDNAACLRLVETMRSNMSGVVRAYETQKNMYKNRVAGDITQEINGGYQSIDEILSNRIEKYPDYRLAILLAQMRFSQAGYARGQNMNADDVLAMRHKGFEAIHKAAEIYAEKLKHPGEMAESNEVYGQWFALALGGSEISQVRDTDDFSPRELEQLTKAIGSLEPAVADRQLSLFASSVIGQMASFKSETKPWVLRQAQTVLGGHPMGRPLAAIVESYEDILREIKLDVSVDGPTDVGSGQPFGLLISFHHSARLARETGGFQRYFSTISRASMVPMSQRSFQPREEVEKKLRGAISDRFEIVSFVLAPNETTPYDLPREGWQATPLAYAIVKARDASVDTIPALQVEMDFADRAGSVVLQVGSASVPVSARSHASRPLAALQVEQTLNDSELAHEGSMTLLIRATGSGLIPALDELMNLSSLADFNIIKREDGGLKMDKLLTKAEVASDAQPTAQTTREWKLTLQPRQTVRGQATFKFPGLAQSFASQHDHTLTYRKYAETDMEQVSSEVALQGKMYPSSRLVWPWFASGAALTLTATGVYLLRKRRQKSQSIDGVFESPAPETPFACLQVLHQIMREQSAAMPPEDRQQLSLDIRQIEKFYFSRSVAQPDQTQPDIHAIAQKWRTFVAHSTTVAATHIG